MSDLSHGLLIAGAGMGGVFAALAVLMVLVIAIGAAFGKKKAKKTDGKPADRKTSGGKETKQQ